MICARQHARQVDGVRVPSPKRTRTVDRTGRQLVCETSWRRSLVLMAPCRILSCPSQVKTSCSLPLRELTSAARCMKREYNWTCGMGFSSAGEKSAKKAKIQIDESRWSQYKEMCPNQQGLWLQYKEMCPNQQGRWSKYKKMGPNQQGRWL